MTTQEAQFNVGGVRLARPFRIRRLGHFGVNVRDPEASRDFYCRLLGFRISDPLDFGPRLPRSEEHTSELQSHSDIVCRLLLEKKKNTYTSERSTRAAQRPRTGV